MQQGGRALWGFRCAGGNGHKMKISRVMVSITHRRAAGARVLLHSPRVAKAIQELLYVQLFGATLVLAATDETLATGTISPETWALCETPLGSSQACLELVTVLAKWHAISQVARSPQMPIEGGHPSWPPDARCRSNGVTG
jgi:hypothetical protein